MYYAECGEAPPYYIKITAFWVRGHLLVKYNAAIEGKRQVHSSKTLVSTTKLYGVIFKQIVISISSTMIS